jgi:hypothetical protein
MANCLAGGMGSFDLAPKLAAYDSFAFKTSSKTWDKTTPISLRVVMRRNKQPKHFLCVGSLQSFWCAGYNFLKAKPNQIGEFRWNGHPVGVDKILKIGEMKAVAVEAVVSGCPILELAAC